MAGYTRVDTGNNIADGNVISAADLDNEFDGIQAAFNANTGHNHDGTTGEGAPILVLGPTQDVVVGASTVTPKTTNTVDIGSSSLKFKDLYMAGNASIGGTLAVTGVATLTAQPILSSLTASRAVFTDGSKGLVSNAITGTGNVVMSASPTLTGTITAEALTLSGAVTASAGTANGVAYLNGSKVLTTGSALTFDGSKFTVLPTGAGGGELFKVGFSGGSNYVRIGAYSGYGEVLSESGNMVFGASGANNILLYTNSTLQQSISSNGTTVWNVGGSEQMRLTSTGLGIGTSSPAQKLHVVGTGQFNALQIGANNTDINQSTLNPIVFKVTGSEFMRLDSSGNLGLGVTPSAWGSFIPRAIELPNGVGFASQSNAAVGHFSANAYYDGSWRYKANGVAARYALGSDTHAWYTAPSGTAGNAISFSQVMTLDASGNLVLGATSANARLDVVGGSIRVNEDSIGTKIITVRSNFAGLGPAINVTTSDPLLFLTANTERARIDSSGALLVGTTTNTNSAKVFSLATASGPAYACQGYSGDVNVPAALFGKFDNDSTTSQVLVRFTINNNSAGSGQINANGANSAAFGSFSDARLKENIADLSGQLDNVMALRPVEFDYIESEGGGHQVGFIAQEMQEVYPDAVGERSDGMLTVTGWSKTEARLVKAIQEQQAIIESLKARLDALEAT